MCLRNSTAQPFLLLLLLLFPLFSFSTCVHTFFKLFLLLLLLVGVFGNKHLAPMKPYSLVNVSYTVLGGCVIAQKFAAQKRFTQFCAIIQNVIRAKHIFSIYPLLLFFVIRTHIIFAFILIPRYSLFHKLYMCCALGLFCYARLMVCRRVQLFHIHVSVRDFFFESWQNAK